MHPRMGRPALGFPGSLLPPFTTPLECLVVIGGPAWLCAVWVLFIRGNVLPCTEVALYSCSRHQHPQAGSHVWPPRGTGRGRGCPSSREQCDALKVHPAHGAGAGRENPGWNRTAWDSPAPWGCAATLSPEQSGIQQPLAKGYHDTASPPSHTNSSHRERRTPGRAGLTTPGFIVDTVGVKYERLGGGVDADGHRAVLEDGGSQGGDVADRDVDVARDVGEELRRLEVAVSVLGGRRDTGV